MALLTILEYPDPLLSLQSQPVDQFDLGLERLVDDLLETMYATSCIGLSAPQANVQQRVLVIDLSNDGSAPEIYINPEILESAAPGIVEESCLSVPGIKANVIRSTRARVRALGRDGKTFERDLDGMQAVCLQHEIDHLDGLLLIDRLSYLRRLFALRKLNKQRALAKSEKRDAA